MRHDVSFWSSIRQQVFLLLLAILSCDIDFRCYSMLVQAVNCTRCWVHIRCRFDILKCGTGLINALHVKNAEKIISIFQNAEEAKTHAWKIFEKGSNEITLK